MAGSAGEERRFSACYSAFDDRGAEEETHSVELEVGGDPATGRVIDADDAGPQAVALDTRNGFRCR